MLKNTSSEQIVRELLEIETQERGLEENALDRLTELLRRGYHLAQGYPSMFEFCFQRLGYSAGKASRRSSALKCLESISDPKREDVLEKLKSGALTLTHLTQVQKAADKTKATKAQREEVLTRLENTSTREAERVLIGEFGLTSVVKETVRPVTETESRLTLIVDEETLSLLEEFKNLTAHQNPYGSSSLALKLALQTALKKKTPKPFPAPEMKTENPIHEIPSESGTQMNLGKDAQGQRIVTGKLRSQVWHRDKGRCTYFNGKTGRKCGSKYMLQIDHIKTYANGGKTEINNLRLLCRSHHHMRNSTRH